MPDAFDGFTEDLTQEARLVLSLAQEESLRFNHNYIGTEHLLLGLIRVEPTIASKALAGLGVETHKVYSAIEFIIGRGDRIVLGEIGLTPRSKKVIALGRDESRRLGHIAVGPEHLLLGLMREGEGIACGVLESLGCSLEKTRAAVTHVIEHPNEPFPARIRPYSHSRRRGADMAGVLTLICRDVGATAAFYIEYLDASALDLPGAEIYAVLGAERLIQLAASGPLLALRAADSDETGAARGGVGGAEISVFTRDALTLWAKLQARDTPGISTLSDVPRAPGAHMFTITDPDGRAVRFYGPIADNAG